MTNFVNRAAVETSFATMGLRLHLLQAPPGRKMSVAQIVWTEIEDGDDTVPCAVLSKDAARELFDGLWRAGLRPVDAGQNEGRAEAMKEHIKDLRYVTSKLLDNATMDPMP